jgi:hypothetical protein
MFPLSRGQGSAAGSVVLSFHALTTGLARSSPEGVCHWRLSVARTSHHPRALRYKTGGVAHPLTISVLLYMYSVYSQSAGSGQSASQAFETSSHLVPERILAGSVSVRVPVLACVPRYEYSSCLLSVECHVVSLRCYLVGHSLLIKLIRFPGTPQANTRLKYWGLWPSVS